MRCKRWGTLGLAASILQNACFNSTQMNVYFNANVCGSENGTTVSGCICRAQAQDLGFTGFVQSFMSNISSQIDLE